MSYTVGKLVTNAYYTSGIVSRDFQTVQGSQMQDGIDCLNDILGETSVDNEMIPFYSRYSFNAESGKQTYFIPNLIEVDSLVFFINTIRYQMNPVQRRQYYGTGRADSIRSLPFTYHVEREVGGATINLYFLPDVNYPMEAWGLFKLQGVGVNQDLESPLTNFSLGAALRTGTGTLLPGQLVINGSDMAGAYADVNALVLAINAFTPINGVSAVYTLNNLMLSGRINITVTTSGIGDPANTFTFLDFSTIAGQHSEMYLPMELERFYISYLKYRLAVRLCSEFNYNVPASVQKELDEMQQSISKRSQQMDLKATYISTLGQNQTLSYAQVNLGKGWTI